MLNVTNITVKKEATLTVQDVEYRVIYEFVNGIVNSISCSIVKATEGMFTEVGNIRKEKGQVNSFIHESEDYIQNDGLTLLAIFTKLTNEQKEETI